MPDFGTVEEFTRKYDELKSARKMGKYYNCSSTAILNHAKKIGYDVNSNKEYKLSDQDKKEILDQYSIKSSNQLAEEYGVSRGMITKLWNDAHLINKKIEINKTAEKNLEGLQFGFWTVLYKTDKRNSAGIIYWHCRCKCGIEKDVLGSSLRSGLSLSCGNHSNISKGNEKITEILLKSNIPFETEKTFDTL